MTIEALGVPQVFETEGVEAFLQGVGATFAGYAIAGHTRVIQLALSSRASGQPHHAPFGCCVTGALSFGLLEVFSRWIITLAGEATPPSINLLSAAAAFVSL